MIKVLIFHNSQNNMENYGKTELIQKWLDCKTHTKQNSDARIEDAK